MNHQATFLAVEDRSPRTGMVVIAGESTTGREGPERVEIRLTKAEAHLVVHELMEWLEAQ